MTSRPGRLINLLGKQYFLLNPVRFSHMQGNHSIWECVCKCGAVVFVRSNNLRTGHTKSCGCYNLEQKRSSDTKYMPHAGTKFRRRTPTYQSWRCMRERCRYPSNASYPSYGGKGISVCDRWKFFINFVADMGERPEGSTLDRINPFGNYEPSNCRWLSKSEQQKNKRSNYGL